MKVLQIVPALNTAITTLAKHIVRNNRNKIDIRMVTFHPKKPDKHELKQIADYWPKVDVVDCQYWKSAAKIRELFPNLWSTKKKILTHYNPYNLKEESWSDYTTVVVVNNYQHSIIPTARLIPLCIDLKFFSFNRSNYTLDPVVNMSVNRIEGKKGVWEVAKACKELDYKFLLVGRVADGEYMNRVKEVGGDSIIFKNSVSDNELKDAYYASAVHVCNSQDNFESGTMPVLESMSCGLPVVSRRVGHVPDLYNGKNIHIYEGHNEDVESLKTCLQSIMKDRRYRIDLRIEAEKTVQDRSDTWRAEEYAKLYRELA